MRVVFFGSPPFAVPIFERLLESTHEVAALVTRPDRRRGRGLKVTTSPLVDAAREQGVRVLQPQTTKDAGFLDELRALEAGVFLVASYGEILRSELIDMPPHGSLNVHASLLPRWRGASPIQRAIEAGDERTGVSVQRVVLALDEGDVLLERSTPIAPDETAGTLLERLAVEGSLAAVEALDALQEGRAEFTPQDPDRVTYAHKLKKEDGAIDWTRPADEIERKVRAFSPWPGAHTTLPDGRALGVLAARPVTEGAPGGEPGAVANDPQRLVVATGDGALELTSVKPAGKGAMDGASFLRGARLPAGTRLGA